MFFSICAAHHSVAHHRSRDRAKPPYCCNKCEYVTMDRQAIRNHRKKHTGEKSYALKGKNKPTQAGEDSIVGRLLSGDARQKETLSNDSTDTMQLKPKRKSTRCTKCGMVFPSACDKKAHVKSAHSKWKCRFCHYATPCKRLFEMHAITQHTHPRHKPFRCPYCDYVCATNGNTRVHVQQQHKGCKVHVRIEGPVIPSDFDINSCLASPAT